MPGGKINKQNEEQLKAVMKNALVPDDVFIPTFMKGGDFAEQRKKVAKELGLACP